MFAHSPSRAPLNTYPWWKYALIIVVAIFSVLYAIPNLYGEVPALQISAERHAVIDQALQEKVEQTLKQAQLPFEAVRQEGSQLMVHLATTEQQLRGQSAIQAALGEQYTVALNLAPATPPWLQAIGASPMKRGLDLRGGIHFLMQIDMAEAIKKYEEQYVNDVKSTLRDEKLRYAAVLRLSSGGVAVKFRDEAGRDQAYKSLQNHYREWTLNKIQEGEAFYTVQATLSPAKRKEIQENALQQNLTTLRNRVNQLGVAEPIIQRQGADKIVVQLPGVQDSTQAKKILSATASLEFHLVDDERDVRDALAGRVPPDAKLYSSREEQAILLKKDVIISGDRIIDASLGYGENGTPQVDIALDSAGGKKMSAVSRESIGRRLAVVFIEYKNIGVQQEGSTPQLRKIEEVITAPVIQSQLGSRFRITGNFTQQEASNLALLLRAGALSVPAPIVEERTIGPSLGQENIKMGMQASLVGLIVVAFFMALYYRVFGLIANVALMLNLILLVAVISLIPGATLTMPGIAGILLTVGMAVDANVLINERIREELRHGASVQMALNQGYDRAFATITDSNVTTLIAALILFAVGTGPIKGFAIVLSVGILTSMFTAIMVTRAIVNLSFGGRSVKRLYI